MRTSRGWVTRPSRAGARSLLAVLAALECELAGLPDWVLENRVGEVPAGVIAHRPPRAPDGGAPRIGDGASPRR